MNFCSSKLSFILQIHIKRGMRLCHCNHFYANVRGIKNNSYCFKAINTIHLQNSFHITIKAAAATAKSLQSCPTLCDPIDSSPPDSPVPGILQARTLEWVAISFSNLWKWKVKGKSLSHVQLFVNPWIAAYQAPPSMGFARQEYGSGVPPPSPTIQATIIKK